MQFTIGDELPGFTTAALTAADFTRYAEASGDHNPLHLDGATAHAAGQADVIAHGMLVMGLLGRVATAAFGPGALRELQARFVAPTLPGEVVHCGGRVTEIGPDRIVGELWAQNAAGAPKATAAFVAAWKHEPV